MPYDVEDTIVAIASPPGGAARGILRVAGPGTVDCLRGRFEPDRSSDDDWTRGPAVAVDGRWWIQDRKRHLPCRLYLWPGTRSYARQPTAELHLLGSPPLLQLVLEQLCRGQVRLAEPGEFTLRAFLAGRLDLTQAEAVLGVIDAKSSRQLHVALKQLAGGLSEPLTILRDQLLNLCADLEAGLDFVDEHIEFVSTEQVRGQLKEADGILAKLLGQLATRRRADGVPVVALRGTPNVGKSTLWNALLGRPEAIVSPIPGTTRDYLRGPWQLDGLRCELVDSAGIDSMLASPIDRSAQLLADQLHTDADLVVLCLDGSRALSSWEQYELAQGTADVVVVTKSDRLDWPAFQRSLPADAERSEPKGRIMWDANASENASVTADAGGSRRGEMILVSGVTGEGLELLRRTVRAAVAHHAADDPGLVSGTAARCQTQLQAAAEAITRAIALSEADEGHELIAAELRETLNHLGQIVGAIYTDDILDRVFSRFCIGK